MDKKLIKYGTIIVGALIVIVVFLLLVNSVNGGTKLSYDKIEEKLVNAARKYVNSSTKSGIDLLPESYLSDSYYLSSDVLVNEGYLKDLSSYAKDDVICTGGVNIYNAGDNNYDYVPELSCGSFHETTRLVDVVLRDNNSGVTRGSGLYLRRNGNFVTKDSDLNIGTNDYEYVFRGDDVNNYISLDDNLFRIVSIDSNNNMLLILNSHSSKTFSWDNKYNESINKYQGINDYENNGLESSIYKALKGFKTGDIGIVSQKSFGEEIKHLTVPMNLCIGKRKPDETDISGKVECSKTLNNQFIGLLPVYSFMSASLDSSCTTISSKNCGNYNYLAQFNDFWWLLTANSENTNEAYFVNKKIVNSYICSYSTYIRPTIKIGARALYKDGDGSKDNPYVVKFYEE